MDEELISVIVPIYNVKNFLPICINSLIGQTYKNLEILLIDDGSNDGSENIADEYSKKYSNIYSFHKQNGGLSDARNYGIDRAKGKYICFIDSDDYVDERYCEILYKNIKDAKADISICEYLRTEDNNKKQVNYDDESTKVYTDEIEKQNNILNKMNEITTVAWNKLYNIELWKDIRYPKGKLNEDEFVIHYLIDKAHSIVYTNLKLYYYYQRENSIMKSKYNEKRLDGLDAFKDRMNFYRNNKKYDSLFPKAYVLYMKFITSHYILAKRSNMQEICKKIIERYRNDYDRQIKIESKKDKLQLLLFLYFPTIYCFLKEIKYRITNID